MAGLLWRLASGGVCAQSVAIVDTEGGRLDVFTVESSGEIQAGMQLPLKGQASGLFADPDGRFGLYHHTHSLHSFRAGGASIEIAGSLTLQEGFGFAGAQALSGTGLLVTVEAMGFSATLRTYQVVNDLSIRRLEGEFPLPESLFGLSNFLISDQEEMTLVCQVHSQHLFTLRIDPETGELSETGGTLGFRSATDLDISSDGRWITAGGRFGQGAFGEAILEVGASGELTVHDYLQGPDVSGGRNHFRPNMESVITTGFDLWRYPLNPDATFAGGVARRLLVSAQAYDVTSDSQFALVNHQDSSLPGFPFALTTFGFAPDGGWTGPHDSHPCNYIADAIVFMPPRTQPTLLGDANLDGLVDSADIVFLVNEAMPDDRPILLPPNFANADLDQDVDVDQDDLEALVQLLAGE